MKFIEQNYTPQAVVLIAQAVRQAVELTEGENRYDGSPISGHSIGVAGIVSREMNLGENSVVAALLHDVVRTGKMTMKEVEEGYGKLPVKVLEGMNSISRVDAKVSAMQVDNFRELIISYSTDPRVLLIKLADRLEVMRSLEIFPSEKRTKKSWETIHIYAPLAHKLGLYNIKTELEDLSLKYLEPQQFVHITQKLRDSDQQRREYIEKFLKPVRQKLDTLGIKYKVKSRTKSVYSIWKKMVKQKVPFEGVFDLFAIRIIVDCEVEQEKMQCWTIFSIVTDFYTPNPNRMRDWISIPKSNGYESLHATVLDNADGEARWVEVQIRSERMDQEAEQGVAAHWRYKEQGAGSAGSEEWLERLRGIVDSAGDQRAVFDEFDFTLGTAEVFVFTPNGDLRKLPEGSTVLDFAFDIHSNLGATCSGAVVNGKAVSIRETLKSGDIVQIKTSKTPRAKVNWLNYVVTNKAKSKIRQILREELASSATLGREELERKLKNWRLNVTLEETVTLLCKHYKVKTGLEVYDMIAEGRAQLPEVKEHILKYLAEGMPIHTPVAKKTNQNENNPKRTKNDALIIDKGASGIDYHMAKCCAPIWGDQIFGFVTINSGITIHRTDCPNATRLRTMYPYRLIEAQWRAQSENTGAFLVTILLEGSDSQGVTADVSDLLTKKLGLSIRHINLSGYGGSFRGEVVVEVNNAKMVDTALQKLREHKSIDKAQRIK